MAIDIGRLGALGLAIEDTAGTAEAAPVVYLNYSGEVSIKEVHEPIPVVSAHSRREEQTDSVEGKKRGEGAVPVLLDTVKAGYLFKLALGNEQLTAGTPNQHLFYPTVSGNAPKTATLWHDRGSTDVIRTTRSAINTLGLTVSDGLAELNAEFMSAFPTIDNALTPTTTSGTVLSFKDYNVKFGTDLADAAGNNATCLQSFELTINNNLEPIYCSGSNDISDLRSKQLQVEGNYTLFFTSVEDRDAYRSLQKRSLIFTGTGQGSEQIIINLSKFRLNEWAPSSNLDDFYVEQGTFMAELNTAQVPNFIDVRLDNDKGTVY